jgi:D-alanyl-lipoteichoic acid acyltransferase DltB (MBOAT superfamily)
VKKLNALSPRLSLAACFVPALGLAYFKYAGFLTGAGMILPLGISFYTFKAMAYLFEVRKGNLLPKDLILTADYICFFPAFLAGPINRPDHFFRELEQPFVFSYADQKNGFVQMAIGLFEKIVIAEFLGRMTAQFYNPALSGWYTVLAVLFYAFYIYADFDAYSNAAIGLARMMGFHLERNFHAPYCAASIMEFWRRWHISLSEWLKNYVYIPLGGSRRGTVRKYINIMIVFLVSGLWHGSTILFVTWGLGHGIIHVLESMIASRFKEKPWVRYLKPVLVILNFVIVALLWVFFRSSDLSEVGSIFARISSLRGIPLIDVSQAGISINEYYWTFVCLAVLVITDLLRYRMDMISFLSRRVLPLRWAFYALLILTAMIFGVYGPGYHPEDFIYVTF